MTPAPFRPDLSPVGRQHRGQGSFHRLARKLGLWAPFSKGPQWKNSSSPPVLEAPHRRYERPVRTQTQAGIQRAQWRDSSGSRRQGPRTPPRAPGLDTKGRQGQPPGFRSSELILSGRRVVETAQRRCGPMALSQPESRHGKRSSQPRRHTAGPGRTTFQPRGSEPLLKDWVTFGREPPG